MFSTSIMYNRAKYESWQKMPLYTYPEIESFHVSTTRVYYQCNFFPDRCLLIVAFLATIIVNWYCFLYKLQVFKIKFL